MANLQALGADNNTIIYLSAVGEGTQLSPFKSIFSAEQYGAWNVSILNSSIAVTGDFFPEVQAVSQSGAWDVTVLNPVISVDNFPAIQAVSADALPLPAGAATEATQQSTLTALAGVSTLLEGTLTVETNLTPLTDTQLRAAPVPVAQSAFPGFDLPNYDAIELGYTGDDLTSVVYKDNGETVATLNLSYSNGVLTTVERV